jgi:lipopolysaccharide heptosyltransferase II
MHEGGGSNSVNVRFMKALDVYVGLPACVFLWLVSKLSFRRSETAPEHPRKILLMKYFGIGSIVLATPLLSALRRRHPAATIGFLTLFCNRDVVERTGVVDNVYVLRTDGLGRFAVDLLTALWRIRQTRYDVTIDMEFLARFSAITTYLSGSPVRIGFHMRELWRGNLLSHRVQYDQSRHITEVFAALAEPLGAKVQDYRLLPPVTTAAEESSAGRILQNLGITDGELLILVNVNASDLSVERRWPVEHFRLLAGALLRELRARVAFIGAKSERGYVDQVLSGIAPSAGVINLAGKTSLGELLCVMKRAGLLVTNDSGPLHLAAALGVPTVSLFGPETPALYGPRGGDALVFYQGINCSPCLSVLNAKTAPCAGENICMRALGYETVLDGIRTHFARLWREHSREATVDPTSLTD